ncbi:MAG: NUDIX hydrolase [Candidatus Freyrarchaeum guaymaensis]|nr:NUDIX hydrolase [Candidatus Sigynarchaeota archaeon]
MVVVIAIVIVRDADGRVLLVRENGLWAIPGGRVEEGEGVMEAAEREIREETGYSVAIENLARVYELKWSGDYHLFFVFRGRIVRREGEGGLVFKWFSLEEIKKVNTYPETYLLLKNLDKKIEFGASRGGIRFYL